MPLKVWQLDPAQMTTYYNLALCSALARAGCDVRYVTSRFLYDENLPDLEGFVVDTHYFRGLSWPILLHYPRLRRLLRAISYPFGHLETLQAIRRERPDIVHVQWSRLPRLDGWLIRRVRAAGIPVVHSVHDVVPLFALNANPDRLGQIYTSVDALIVHTQSSREALLMHYPAIRPERVHVIPHIAIRNHAIPPGASQEAARQSLQLPLTAPVFLFFGAIKAYKGLDVLATAFERVSRERQDAWLVIAGRPDGPQQTRLLQQMQKRANVRVLAEFVPYNDVWRYFYAADVIVFPYHYIYQSGALITALSFGRAVIVTAAGGLPEGVDGNGWVVPPGDAIAFAGAMLAALADASSLPDKGRRSQEILEERFGEAIVAKQTIQLYEALHRGKRP
ncbi:MAG: glycosyltransferase family 4 protein [Anaerolineae bacterium]|nr:glycosyltransferase family 4 protein [Anaerolineae bacterium]